MKSSSSPAAALTLISIACSFLFLDFEHWKFLPLSQKARGHVAELLGHIKNAYWRGSMVRMLNMLCGLSLIIIYRISHSCL